MARPKSTQFISISAKPYKGCVKARKNVITGQIEVIKRYSFIGSDGKMHRTDTPWTNVEDIDKATKRYKKLKQKSEKSKFAASVQFKEAQTKMNAKKTIAECLKEYYESSDRKNLSSKSDARISTVNATHSDIGSVLRFHTPDRILQMKAIDIEASDFAYWISYINSDKTGHNSLSGQAVRRYRGCISGFNNFLFDKGYYDSVEIRNYNKYIMYAEPIKGKKEGKRTDRYTPSFDDLKKILAYYSSSRKLLTNEGIYVVDDFPLQSYESFLWYTLFKTAFMTGMRPEELIGLRYENIDFADGKIHIIDAITQTETVEDVKKRYSKNKRQVKRPASKRIIYMWDYYKSDLEWLKRRTKELYKLNDEEIEECFVFPRFNAKDPKEKKAFLTHKSINKELDKVCFATSVPHFSVQMFRHACPTFLIKTLHAKEDDIYRYFGHQDPTLIRKIYSELTADDKAIESTIAFSKMINSKDLERILSPSAANNSANEVFAEDQLENEIAERDAQQALAEVYRNNEDYSDADLFTEDSAKKS